MKWSETSILTDEGLQLAIAPEIISASRATDIPAFHAEWFMHRLRQGYLKWVNPFSSRAQYVSFENARVIVFWSKNPRPLIPHLGEIDDRGIAYYFQFTLNDYEKEKLEPGVPPLSERIDTFQTLSQKIGKERVIWRFDPLILMRNLSIEQLLEKVKRVGDQIAPYTTKLVFSFADISGYKKVEANLRRGGFPYVEFDKETMTQAAASIAGFCREWGITAATCAEPMDFSMLGIGHNRCIDDRLILNITNNDPAICRLLAKDPGQRADCGCILSKDIGQYNTCSHFCAYCYANASEKLVKRNAMHFSKTGETIVGNDFMEE